MIWKACTMYISIIVGLYFKLFNRLLLLHHWRSVLKMIWNARTTPSLYVCTSNDMKGVYFSIIEGMYFKWFDMLVLLHHCIEGLYFTLWKEMVLCTNQYIVSKDIGKTFTLTKVMKICWGVKLGLWNVYKIWLWKKQVKIK